MKHEAPPFPSKTVLDQIVDRDTNSKYPHLETFLPAAGCCAKKEKETLPKTLNPL